MNYLEVGPIILACVSFVPCLMQLTLGAAFLSQICDGDSFIPENERLGEQAFLWPQPLRCYCNVGGQVGPCN